MENFFWKHYDYYFILITLLSIIGAISFFSLSKTGKRNPVNLLLISNLLLVLFYENLAVFLSSQGIINHWVYNIFYTHFATFLLLFLIGNYIKNKPRRNLVRAFALFFLIVSIILYIMGVAEINDAGEIISFVSSTVIIISCFIYFLELITRDEYLELNLLRYSGFWIVTCLLFYFSASFMIFISFKYLYINHLDVYYMVIEIPRIMAILTSFIFALTLVSVLLQEKNKIKLLDV